MVALRKWLEAKKVSGKSSRKTHSVIYQESETYVIKSFLSLSFFKPPKAILVPGMYFLGFSRYSNYMPSPVSKTIPTPFIVVVASQAYQSVFIPDDTLLLVGIGVGEALNGSRLASKETVKVRSDLVGTALLEGVALGTAGLEQVRTLSVVTW